MNIFNALACEVIYIIIIVTILHSWCPRRIKTNHLSLKCQLPMCSLGLS